MVLPLASIPEFQGVPYPKMTEDIANLNLAQISEYVSSAYLRTNRKGKIREDEGWFRRFNSRLDIASVERTYEISLKVLKDADLLKKISGFNANFDASLKGLENLIVHFEARNTDSYTRLKALQTKINSRFEEPVVQSEIPVAPPQPKFVTTPERKLVIKRRHQSVCLDKENLKVDFMTELFASIKLKAPLIPEVSISKIEDQENKNEWEKPAPLSESNFYRKPIERTVSFYDQRQPQVAPTKKFVPVSQAVIEDLQTSLILAVSARRNSMRGKKQEKITK